MKKLLIGIGKIVLYLSFVAVLVYATPKLLSKVLRTPYPMATITSGSMWPALRVDDLILMQGVSGKDVKIGEIIVYQNASQGFTIHRLIRKEEGQLVTRGDANEAEDQPIAEADVIGRILTIGIWPVRIPYLGIIAREFGPQLQKIQNPNDK